MTKRHPNKHIRAAIEYAESQGWVLIPGRGHAFGILRCPNGCRCAKSIWSTPRDPESHAKDVLRFVRRCPK